MPGQDKRKGIERYEHLDKKRLNNPPVGLVTPETDPEAGRKKRYAYDPHLDPQLVWAGKAEHTSFEVPTVSLHVHERIDPLTIIQAVRRRNGESPVQLSLFESERQEPLREAIEFYKHAHGWSNRLIAGDSLLAMNSLLEKEGMAGKVQMIYIDPPYGIKYGSNFQPFVNKRDVKDGKDEDLTAEPEQIRAFRDTWELGIHSYLTYLRDRLLLARELLSESGSIFVQINDENVHLVRCLMDEVFGAGSFVAAIAYRVFGVRAGAFLDSVTDNVVWYGRDRRSTKCRRLFMQQDERYDGSGPVRLYRPGYSQGLAFRFCFEGQAYCPPSNMHWATTQDGLCRLEVAGRLVGFAADARYKRYGRDFPCAVLTTSWHDTWGEQEKCYAVQTSSRVIERCLLMTTDPGDLVFDPTCVRRGTGVLAPTPALPAGGEGASIPPPSTGEARRGDSPSTGEARRGDSPSAGKVSWRIIPIEQIRPGDLVFGHDGSPHRVLRIIRKVYRGLMVGIRHALNDESLWLTADHRVLCKPRPRTLGGNRDWSATPVEYLERRQQLRRESPPVERRLWAALRNRQLGFKFRRQHPIGPYIADFYSREAHLVVEVDGSTHFEPDAVEYDAQRDAYMRSMGIDVLRLTAAEVKENLESACLAIATQCKLRTESAEGARWLQAAALRPGDLVFFGPDLKAVPVQSMELQPTEEEVYDLEVEDVHSFLTEVCAVHNCGSGTTAYVAEKWGRRWITCDTSRVAIALARQRSMTSVFDYYELAHPEEGVGSGFRYTTVPHITLKSIANNPEIDGIYARMHPAIEQALADLNAALKGKPVKFKVTQGGRAGQLVDFAAPDDQCFRVPSGQDEPVNALLEWEVPFEFPADWPEGARKPFEAFHNARRAMQEQT